MAAVALGACMFVLAVVCSAPDILGVIVVAVAWRWAVLLLSRCVGPEGPSWQKGLSVVRCECGFVEGCCQLEIDSDCCPGTQAVSPVNTELVVIIAPVGAGPHQFFDVSAVCDQVTQVVRVFLCVHRNEIIPCGAPFGFCYRSFLLWNKIQRGGVV